MDFNNSGQDYIDQYPETAQKKKKRILDLKINDSLDEDGWMIIPGLILVPAYMFIRATKTNRNYGPPIVWCALEAIFVIR